MPSQITYRRHEEHDSLIGFCVESPAEVLKQLYKTHAIHNYKDLYLFPAPDSEADKLIRWRILHGIVIEDATDNFYGPPFGTSITGTLDSLRPRINRAKLDTPRTEKEIINLFKEVIKRELKDDYNNDYTHYLQGKDVKINWIEKRIEGLLEIVEVTMGVSNPSVSNLSEILGSYQK